MYCINREQYPNINPVAVYELTPNDNRKSFYGKAKVIETETGYYLQSYNTLVCFIFKKAAKDGGVFLKMWDGYSATTMRHINAFMASRGLASCGGKKWWEALPEARLATYSEILNAGA